MYSTQSYQFCVRAQQYFASKPNVEMTKLLIESDAAQRIIMMGRSGRRTVPQMFIEIHRVGGCDDLVALDRAGRLEILLDEQSPG